MSSAETNGNDIIASGVERSWQDQNAFGKKQIMGSVLFSPKEKDVLEVFLQEDGSYRLEDAKQLMELYLNKEVI